MPISCEYCYSNVPLITNQDGFYICTECGTQQKEYNDLYGDDTNKLYWNKNKFTSLDNKNYSLNSTEGTQRNINYTHDSECRTVNNTIEYEVEEEEVEFFDINWKKKKKKDCTENDFIRGLQRILTYCIFDLIYKLGFPLKLEDECKKIWFSILRFFVESDYPAQTFFTDLKQKRVKIRKNRIYTPSVKNIDLDSFLLDDTSVSLLYPIEKLGFDRLVYVRSIAPFHDSTDLKKKVPTERIIKFKESNNDSTCSIPPSPILRQTKKKKLTSIETTQDSSLPLSTKLTELNTYPIISEQDTNTNCHLSLSNSLPLLDIESSDNSPCDLDQAKNKENMNKKFYITELKNLRLKNNKKDRIVAACVKQGVKPPFKNEIKNKYVTDNCSVLGFSEKYLLIMIRERLLSSGPRSKPYLSVNSKSRSHKTKRNSNSVSMMPDVRWQIDQIYEHDFLYYLIQNEGLNSEIELPIVDSLDDTLNLEKSSRYNIQNKSKLEQLLKINLTRNKVLDSLLHDDDIIKSYNYWQRKGLVFSGLSKENKYISWGLNNVSKLSYQTMSNLHSSFFNKSIFRHEVSAVSFIERILRNFNSNKGENSSNSQNQHYQYNDSTLAQHGQYLIEANNESLYNCESDLSNESFEMNTKSTDSKIHKRNDLHNLLYTNDILDRHNTSYTNFENKDKEDDLIEHTITNKISNHIDRDNSNENESNLVSYLANNDLEKSQQNLFLRKFISSYLKIISPKLNKLTNPNTTNLNLSHDYNDNDIIDNSESFIPLKRLDPFYQQDNWSSSRLMSSIEKLMKMKQNILNRKSSSLREQISNHLDEFEIFNKFIQYPTVSITEKRLIKDEELIQFLANLYFKNNDSKQLKFIPILRYVFNKASPAQRPYLRSVIIREAFEALNSPTLLKARFYNENDDFLVPPDIDFKLVATIIWLGLLNTRHAVLSTDICKWINSGTFPLNIALSAIPVWLFEAGGVQDKRIESSNESNIEKNIVHKDRSIFQISEFLRPFDLEKIFINLKHIGIKTAPFLYKSLVPRILHHCFLPSAIQPIILSLIDIIDHPLTQFQNGLTVITRENDVLGDYIYGYCGPFCSVRTVAACSIIICRMMWPIFTYHPLGMPGVCSTINSSKNNDHSSLHIYDYCTESTNQDDSDRNSASILTFDCTDMKWKIFLTNRKEKLEFDITSLGVIGTGLYAIEHIRKESPSDYDKLVNIMHQTKTEDFTPIYNKKVQENKPTTIDNLLIEYLNNIKQEEIMLTPSTTQNIIKLLPTNQELFHRIITLASQHGWMDSLPEWLSLNDSWSKASTDIRETTLRQICSWLYRPTINKGQWKDFIFDHLLNQNNKIIPNTIQSEINHFINDSVPNESEKEYFQTDTINSENPYLVKINAELSQFIEILFKVYLKSVLASFQEPPIPNRCYHPVDIAYKTQIHDTPLEDTRFPIPYAILLRRVSSFIQDDHLFLHYIINKLESWLFVSEVPYRFSQLYNIQRQDL